MEYLVIEVPKMEYPVIEVPIKFIGFNVKLHHRLTILCLCCGPVLAEY